MEASIGHHLSTSAGSRIITEEAFVRVDALSDPAERGTGGDRRLVGYSTFGGFVLGCIEADLCIRFILQYFSRSTRLTRFCTVPGPRNSSWFFSFFLQNVGESADVLR